MDLYNTSTGELPANFRSFPKALCPDASVKTAALGGLGNDFGEDDVVSSPANYSSAYL